MRYFSTTKTFGPPTSSRTRRAGITGRCFGDTYTALRGFGLDIDIVPPRRGLESYKAVFAPALHLVDDALAEHLMAYVQNGGRLIVGPRSGAKTRSDIAQAPAPGPLAELMGVRVDHVDALRPGVNGEVEYSGERYPYATWADLLTPTTAGGAGDVPDACL